MSGSDVRTLGARAQEMIDALAEITAEPGRMTRLFLTPEHKRAAEMVGAWMRRAGLTVRMDAAGTMHGLLPAGAAGERSGRRLLIGSHLDTVIDGGKYDGILGVVAGILAVEEILRRGIALPFALEVLAFGDEEGVRYPKTLMSSSAIAGSLDPNVLDMTDSAGMTMRAALAEFGGDPEHLSTEGYSRPDTVGFIEVHIEQGPVLEQAGEPLGVVTAIASQGRYRVHVRGEAGHAGTVPMDVRHDALAGAAEMMIGIEAVARAGARSSLVATVGEVAAEPGAGNVIPGVVRFSLDVRAADDAARIAAVDEMRRQLRQIGLKRGLVVGVETVHEKPVATCAPWLRRAMSKAIRATTGRPARKLMSGAGHDGQAMAHLTDIGMFFVRCRAGISHNPLEHVEADDMGLAVEALVRTIEGIGDQKGD